MTTIESNVVQVNRPAVEVHAFLADMNNLQSLMPEDKISNWESTNNSCRFTINGMASIGMRIEKMETPNSIHIVADGKNPFDFTLDISIAENGGVSNGQLVFNGKLNPMLKMMAVTPLTNFFNILASNLTKKLA